MDFGGEIVKGAVDGDLYMLDKEGNPKVPYARVIIKRK